MKNQTTITSTELTNEELTNISVNMIYLNRLIYPTFAMNYVHKLFQNINVCFVKIMRCGESEC